MSRKNALAAIADKQKKQTTQLNPNLMIEITNEDNMELMKRYPDNYFDLAIVDPPYGIGISGQKEVKKGKKSDRKGHVQKDWDNAIPNREYFDELFRVSKNQVIWGANYFVEHLTKGTKGWIVWDKAQYGLTMSDCELAYTSFDKPTRVYIKNRAVLINQNTIHPTEKPIPLYTFILQNFANIGDKILDTHIGSGSIAIAVDNANKIDKMNLTLVGCELDKDYYNATMKRIKEQTSWQSLF
jgi:site-specific DNA-methyltransferase (adenine-specific)